MRCGRPDRQHRDAWGDAEQRQDCADLRLVSARCDEHDSRAGGRRRFRARRPLGERHVELAGEGGPEVRERIAQPDDEQRDAAGRRHPSPSSVAVTKVATA